LIQYRKYTRLALNLERREFSGLRTYLRTAPPPLNIEAKLDLTGVTRSDFFQIAHQVFFKAEMQYLSLVMPVQRITIREKIHTILDTLRNNNHSSFNGVLDTKSRLEIVVTFLALLELIKRHVVHAEQPALFEDIQMVSLHDVNEEDLELEFEE
jgi:segregation and condensation protein A